MRALLLLIPAFLVVLSCKKDKKDPVSGDGPPVEIYVLKLAQLVTGKCQIDPAGSILQDTPVIKNEDIISYSSSGYAFTLSDVAYKKAKGFRDWTPFAVTVDKQVIYYGFFKPLYSSSSCDNSITMDIDWSGGSRIVLRLGYPGMLAGVTIDDQRNNATLIASLQKQGKLR